MLKFLRKYQLFILVIGGALLMVVFLLEPVITRLAPSQAKRTIATLETTGEKVRQGDVWNAQRDLDMIGRVAPWLLDPRFPTTMVALAEDEDKVPHWMLLVKEAEANGLVGEAGDGYGWVTELARQESLLNAGLQWLQSVGFDPRNIQLLGLALQQDSVRQQALADAANVEQQIRARLSQYARSVSYAEEDDVAMALARARGVSRLLALYANSPRLSVPGAIAEARNAGDSVAVEAAIVPASAIAGTLPASTPEQIEAHFDRFKDNKPEDNEFGIGYVRGPRLKVSYLTIDPSVIRDQIEIDRIDLRKRYQQNRERYEGEFENEQYRVEADMKTERMRDLMTIADEVVRAEIFRATEPLGVDGPYRELPDDWDTARPTWEQVAEAVGNRLTTEVGSPIGAPEVTTIDDRWLTAADLRSLPGIGQAAFQGTGTAVVQFQALPQFVKEIGDRRELIVQQGLPLAESPAVGLDEARHYVTVLDARPESAPDDMSEIGQEQLSKDERELRAYEQLVGLLSNLSELARARGTGVIPEQFENPATGTSAAEYAASVTVRRDGASGARSPAMNTEPVREAVLGAARDLPSIIEVGSLNGEGKVVSVAVPAQRSIVVAQITGKLPATIEQFRAPSAGGTLADRLRQLVARRVLVENRPEESPGEFSFETMVDRWGYASSRTTPDSAN